MPKRIDYNEGDIVGENGCVFIKELSPNITASSKDRRAIFLCGCKRNYFEASIQRVRKNNTVCKECRRENKSKLSKKLDLKYGDYIDPDKKIRFIEEVEPIKKYGRRFRVVRVFDEKYNEEFIARLQDIRSGNTTRGKRGRHERHKEVYEEIKDKLIEGSKKAATKYYGGETFGPSNEIILLEIVGVDKNGRRKGKFYNKITKKEFITTIGLVVSGHSWGKNISKGEDLIGYLLKNMGVSFIKEKTFKDCINPETNYLLRFDFYLPDYNCCIEYDGEQHFYYKGSGWNNKENFIELTKRDAIKNEYCKNHNIKLIRIPYTDFDKIDKTFLFNLIQS